MLLSSKSKKLKPVLQTLEYPEGNCFGACLASILELSIDDVPNHHGFNWYNRYEEWLYRNFRCKPLYWEEDELPDFNLLAWWIAEVESPRNKDIKHSVVFYRNEFRWDPYPNASHQWKCSDTKSVIAIYSISSILES
jgi:hypothetical protein